MDIFTVSLFGHRKIEHIHRLVERDKGGAYTAMKYAQKLNKNVINLQKQIE